MVLCFKHLRGGCTLQITRAFEEMQGCGHLAHDCVIAQIASILALILAWVYIFDTVLKEREKLESPQEGIVGAVPRDIENPAAPGDTQPANGAGRAAGAPHPRVSQNNVGGWYLSGGHECVASLPIHSVEYFINFEMESCVDPMRPADRCGS